MGALFGAVIAGGIALYTSYQNAEAAADAKDAAAKAAAKLKAEYQNLIDDVEAHYSKEGKESSTYANEDDYTAYLEKLRNSDSEATINKFYDELYGLDENGNRKDGKFEYDKEVSDFMDPRADYLKNLAAESVMGTAAGAGLGRSYFGAKAMANAVVNKDEELYKNALSEYNADRSQSYNEWNSYLQQKQNELSNLLTGQSNDLSNAKSLADLYKADQDAEWNDIMNSRIAALNAGYAVDTAVNNTGNYTYDVGGIANAVGAGANLGDKVSNYFGGGDSTGNSTGAAS